MQARHRAHIKSPSLMKLFRNSRFTSRNYECTNIVWCRADSLEQIKQIMPQSQWSEVEEGNIAPTAQQLWKQGPVTFFGWL
jgi:long-subunit acyl-CoA synthetase (AMP-forming)